MKAELLELIVAGNGLSVTLHRCTERLEHLGAPCADSRSKLAAWHNRLEAYCRVCDLSALHCPGPFTPGEQV